MTFIVVLYVFRNETASSTSRVTKAIANPVAKTRKIPEVSVNLKERTGIFLSLASLFDVTMHLSTLGMYSWNQWYNNPLSHNTLSLFKRFK